MYRVTTWNSRRMDIACFTNVVAMLDYITEYAFKDMHIKITYEDYM